MSVDRSPDYDKVHYVLSIYKSMSENMGISNFPISQVRFDMHTLYWIIIKILYRKPQNQGSVDDNDLYLMLTLMTESGVNWVMFIIDRVFHYKHNPKGPLFFTSFMQLILKTNGIVSKEEDLVKASKILDKSGFSMMRYYRDTYDV